MAKAKTTKAKRTTIRSTDYEYTVIFEPAEEGGYVVTVPALPGLHTEGDTFEGARAMAEEAIRGYLECLREDGADIPVEHGYPITHRVAVSLAKA
ncbi:MAG: type II toxin-antitoxin system HicB family antitoxin [Deltaproteobacteria bacterium]|nr:type II toxin-antitoxin system HicB family antitoxin [Deltaproteobacteria bacterium]